MNFDSPGEITKLLQSRNLNFKKRFGQNFLINRTVREKIIKILNCRRTDHIWEIGPGLGSMTDMIPADKITVFEIDNGYIKYLSDVYGNRKDFRIISGDVVKTWKKNWEVDKPDIIFGNLPYNTASTIITSLIQNDCITGRMVFTIQKELGLRMTAVPCTKNYSSFSIVCQFAFDIINHGEIKPGAFFPAPKVDSIIVELKSHKNYSDLKNKLVFFDLVRDLFLSRRKTIKNNICSGKLIKKYRKEHLLESAKNAEISLEKRGEAISVSDIVKFSKYISSTL